MTRTVADRERTAMDEARRIQIGRRLKELREHARMTQPQVAEKAGLGFRTYQSYEYGENATDVETYEKLAAVFGVSAIAILGSENGAPPWVEEIRGQLTEILDRLDLLEAELAATLIGQQSESATPPSEADVGEATGP